MLELLQRCYDAGDIELDAYSGKYCVSCEEYYTDDELLEGGLCPVHRTPVEYYEEENYFFRLSRFQDRLLDWYALHPDAIKPEHRSREALGLIRGGLRDFSVSRTSVSWGIPLPWDPAHVTLRVVRRADQLLVGGRLRRPASRITPTGGRSTTTSSARTSSATTASTGRRC